MGLPRAIRMCPLNFSSRSSFLVASFREEAEIGIALEATRGSRLCGPGCKMLFDSAIEFYARADSRRVFCEYAATPIEQNLAHSRMAPSVAKRPFTVQHNAKARNGRFGGCRRHALLW